MALKLFIFDIWSKFKPMKSILRILLLLSIFITANVNSSQASHLLGGEITWKCVNVGGIQKYKFTVVVYRDCTGCVGCLGATDELKYLIFFTL